MIFDCLDSPIGLRCFDHDGPAEVWTWGKERVPVCYPCAYNRANWPDDDEGEHDSVQ